MNIKKLLIGNFFLTFIWIVANLLLPLQRQTTRNDKTKSNF